MKRKVFSWFFNQRLRASSRDWRVRAALKVKTDFFLRCCFSRQLNAIKMFNLSFFDVRARDRRPTSWKRNSYQKMSEKRAVTYRGPRQYMPATSLTFPFTKCVDVKCHVYSSQRASNDLCGIRFSSLNFHYSFCCRSLLARWNCNSIILSMWLSDDIGARSLKDSDGETFLMIKLCAEKFIKPSMRLHCRAHLCKKLTKEFWYGSSRTFLLRPETAELKLNEQLVWKWHRWESATRRKLILKRMIGLE